MSNPVFGDDWIMFDENLLDLDVDKEVERLFGDLTLDGKKKRCYCGKDKAGDDGRHSDYCPKYKEE